MEQPQPPPAREPLSRRVARRVRLPRLSGKVTAGWLAVCFLLPLALIPLVLRLPPWIEFEIVLAIWWVIWLAVLARLLYTGHLVTDDHVSHQPRSWFPKGSGDGWGVGLDWGSDLNGEGCAVVVGIVVAVVVLFVGAWFLIEIAIPILWLLLYFIVRGMLAAVVNDRHRCRGKVGKALAHAFLWATVYVAPLALIVWFIHHLYQRQGGA